MRDTVLTLLVITLCILHFDNNSLAGIILFALSGSVIIYFGASVIRNSKRFAEDRIDRFGESAVHRVLNLQYRENPLRLTITLAGVTIIAIGSLFLVLASSKDANDAFEGFRRIVLISALVTVMSCGAAALITALFMLKRR